MATSILKLYAEPLIKGQWVSPSPFSQWAGRGRDPVWRAADESLGGLGQAEWGPEPICPSCLGNPATQPLTETAGTASSGGYKGPAPTFLQKFCGWTFSPCLHVSRYTELPITPYSRLIVQRTDSP